MIMSKHITLINLKSERFTISIKLRKQSRMRDYFSPAVYIDKECYDDAGNIYFAETIFTIAPKRRKFIDDYGNESYRDKYNNILYEKLANGNKYWYDKNHNCIHTKKVNGYESWNKYDTKNRVSYHRDSTGYEYYINYDVDEKSSIQFIAIPYIMNSNGESDFNNMIFSIDCVEKFLNHRYKMDTHA